MSDLIKKTLCLTGCSLQKDDLKICFQQMPNSYIFQMSLDRRLFEPTEESKLAFLERIKIGDFEINPIIIDENHKE